MRRVLLEKETVMRSLRIRYGISLIELANAAHVSMQYISNVELGIKRGKSLELVQKAFETLIEEKTGRLDKLRKSYFDNKDRLLETETGEANAT